MVKSGGISQVVELLSDEVESMGYCYWGGEFNRHGKRAVLRVYIDSKSDDDGITLDDCAKVSRRLSASLDLRNPITSAYDLEVSSPGLERPLFEAAHYQRYTGRTVKLRCYSPIDGRRRFVGRLVSVPENGVEMDIDGEMIRIDFSNIRDARLVYEVKADEALAT